MTKLPGFEVNPARLAKNIQALIRVFLYDSPNFDPALKIEVLSSTAGYYIGQWDYNEGPFSRLSEEIFPTKEAAEQALTSGNFTIRFHP